MSESPEAAFPEESLMAAVQRLYEQDPVDGSEYYFLTLTTDVDGKVNVIVFDEFEKYNETTPHFEFRKASLIKPYRLKEALLSIHERPVMVNDEHDLFIWFVMVGGHGIVLESIASSYLSHYLGVKATAPRGSKPGFITVEGLPRGKLVKRPNKRLKQKVRQRDENRCKLCRRSPDEHPGVELSLHHITMRKWGGLMEEDNLITVCRKCHDDLKDFNDITMYARIGIDRFAVDASKKAREYAEGVIQYRRVLLDVYRKITEVEDSSSSG